MDDELTPEQKFAAEEPSTMIPRALREGRDAEDIVAELVRLDWTPSAARALIARYSADQQRYNESPESRARLVSEAEVQMVIGLILALMGVAISVFTFIAAIAGAVPFFVVATGLILGGLMMASHGRTRLEMCRTADPTEALVETNAGEKP